MGQGKAKLTLSSQMHIMSHSSLSQSLLYYAVVAFEPADVLTVKLFMFFMYYIQSDL